MSLDPDDPRCPECGGPVSATAIYCMHCGAEFDEDGRDVAPGQERDRDTDSLSPESLTETAAGERGGASEQGDTVDDSDRLLHPDSLADDTLTVLVGVLAGVVAGVLALVFLLLLTQSAWALLLGGGVWLGVTGHLVTRRTVGRAFRRGCYAVAFLLLALPLVAFSGAMEGGDFGGRVILFFAGAFFFGLLALGLAVVGYAVGE